MLTLNHVGFVCFFARLCCLFFTRCRELDSVFVSFARLCCLLFTRRREFDSERLESRLWRDGQVRWVCYTLKRIEGELERQTWSTEMNPYGQGSYPVFQILSLRNWLLNWRTVICRVNKQPSHVHCHMQLCKQIVELTSLHTRFHLNFPAGPTLGQDDQSNRLEWGTPKLFYDICKLYKIFNY